ncbi:pancreatic triacylglycerol lipase-like [Uranotaenia lowii]|uniref:pancreatic triacylglycerol lipase-like n=1 Tax=Uranotaenia lowii TaxID=190385 RepID=UPI00247929C0|nr:pancreatic triacylglycerol lipase-like [Uranotaenia lowii]
MLGKRINSCCLLMISFFWLTANANRVSEDVDLAVFDRNNQTVGYLKDDKENFVKYGCSPGENWTVITYGWHQGLSTDWVQPMFELFQKHRGGCVMIMLYANDDQRYDYFGELLPVIDSLTNSLVDYLKFIEDAGFDPANGLIFGHSVGAQLAFKAGRRFGFQKLGRIDACDPALQGFGDKVEFRWTDPKLAAKQVQCIHTSKRFGIAERNCHVNWNMGDCGVQQEGRQPFPMGSHDLCPHFYNSAFEHDFLPIPKPKKCQSFREVEEWPEGFRMGYYCDMESGVTGDLFSPTYEKYPYNEKPENNRV